MEGQGGPWLENCLVEPIVPLIAVNIVYSDAPQK